MKKNRTKLFREFEGHDRFALPEGLIRVTAGCGGEAFLIAGNEKMALLDCGMAYCAGQLIANIKRALPEGRLDYIFLSHTHYDHIGALPYIRKEWPEATVFGAAHARRVLEKPGAIKTINALSFKAWEEYDGESAFALSEEGFCIDRMVGDGDEISLGQERIAVLETKGHTDCSLTYVLLPRKVMFLSESTGVLESPEHMHVSILKRYSDAIESVEKCRKYGANVLISPHYGVIPAHFNEVYFDLFLRDAQVKWDFLHRLYESGQTEEDALLPYTERYWVEERKEEQPKGAFLLNAKNIIKVFFQEFQQQGEERM